MKFPYELRHFPKVTVLGMVGEQEGDCQGQRQQKKGRAMLLERRGGEFPENRRRGQLGSRGWCQDDASTFDGRRTTDHKQGSEDSALGIGVSWRGLTGIVLAVGVLKRIAVVMGVFWWARVLGRRVLIGGDWWGVLTG